MNSEEAIAQIAPIMVRHSSTLRATFITALNSVVEERARQDNELWGEQNHNPLVWIPILDEEHGEMASAALKLCAPHLHDPSGEYDEPVENLRAHYRKELVQMVAVGFAMIECLDRGKWE